MNDDWRVRVQLREHGLAHELGELLAASELEHDLERSFEHRVIVSVDGPELFAYAGDRAQAQRAEALIRRLATEHGWESDVQLTRWNAAAEAWEDPDAPIADPAAERIADERAESAEQGYPEFEVRLTFAHRSDAAALAHRLAEEGIPHLHRWSVVLVGAADEASAQTLATRLRAEAPAAGTVTVERNERAVYDSLPRSPFTVLGGLGG